LLATAIVEVKNKAGQYIPCRALLDSASQSHCITERCVQRLKLSRIQTHAFIQGISNVNTAAHHSVSIYLRSRHSDWHTTLDCAILSNITGTTPSTKLDTTNWKLPKDIKLADEQFDQPGSIDLLIGADIYEILRSGRHTRSSNLPVLQETVLGWTISGRTPAPTQNGTQRTCLIHEDSQLERNSNRFWEVKPVEQSSTTARQQAHEATRSQWSSRFPKREEEHMLLLPHRPVFKETSSTATTWIAFGGGAKPSSSTQQHLDCYGIHKLTNYRSRTAVAWGKQQTPRVQNAWC
jgi:hypothetical protein